MAVQTAVAFNPGIAYNGQVAHTHSPSDVVSKVAEASALTPGVVVSRGTSDNQVILGGDGTGIGVVVRDLNFEGALADNALSYPDESVVPVMRYGYIYVEIQNTGVPGAALKYNDTTGLISTGAAGAGETVLPGSLESTVASNGDIGLIYVERS